ncbi:MAG: twin-arginine translocase TatA/TatE family subunit [Trueperaceae bacterium]|nr:twin-arginine translocase TatA/TatE family subunit [Trueperaceae bacterium]
MRLGPLGLPEILIILVVVLLIFGPRRLPELAKGLGQSVREFRKGMRDMKKDLDSDDDAPVNAAAPVTSATPVAPTPANPAESESRA